MAVIYLRHPIHGDKVACSEIEAQYDRENGWVDFKDCGIKSPIIMGGQPLLTRAVGFTAEQPQAELQFAVDKVFA